MNHLNLDNEYAYLNLLQHVKKSGTPSEDRTGTGTLSVFAPQMRFNLRQSFPLLTTKWMAWKSIVSELLWFIEGSGDERRLAEILYGKNRSELTDKTTIWTKNANSPYWKHKAKFEGDCGLIYGSVWRCWTSSQGDVVYTNRNLHEWIPDKIDQLKLLIEGLKKDPYSRRHILTAWNPGVLDQMALPPCHMLSQFYVRNGELSCLMTQRSADLLLGAPFNIASYALFTLMIAQVCNLTPGDLILTLGDAHIYNNHVNQVNEQLIRTPLPPPTVTLNPNITDIDQFTMGDIFLHDYTSHPAIKAPMAV